jgi:predicted GNAT family acetyltransferase
MPSPIRDNAALSRFELESDGHVAFANYTTAPGVITLTHTEVPRAMREGGIGTRLVLGTLTDIRARGLKVRPLCSFVRHVIARHPELADLVA